MDENATAIFIIASIEFIKDPEKKTRLSIKNDELEHRIVPHGDASRGSEIATTTVDGWGPVGGN